MIKWRHPSSMPKDTSWVATVDPMGHLEGRSFDRVSDHWRVWSIPGFGERICKTTSGVVGWATWQEVFDHLRATAHLK